MTVRMGAVYCLACGHIIRYVDADLPQREGDGETCGLLEFDEGDVDGAERALKACIARQLGRPEEDEGWKRPAQLNLM